MDRYRSGASLGDATYRERVRRRACLLGVVVAGLVAGSVGCGGGSADPVAAAAAKSGRAGGARVLFELTFSGERLSGGVLQTIQGRGVMHGADDDLTFDFSTGTVSFLQLTGTTGGTIREVKVGRGGDEILYLRVPGLPHGRHWIELDLTEAYRASGLDLGTLAARPETQDPSQLLALLDGEVGKVRDLGATSTLSGTATRYRVTIDLAKALRAKGANGGPPLFLAAASRRTTLSEDVSIGGDGLIRELSATYPMKIRSIPVHLAMKLDFLRYGVKAHVEPPAGSDAFDLTPVLAGTSRA